jgi:hypothetical protein
VLHRVHPRANLRSGAERGRSLLLKWLGIPVPGSFDYLFKLNGFKPPQHTCEVPFDVKRTLLTRYLFFNCADCGRP